MTLMSLASSFYLCIKSCKHLLCILGRLTKIHNVILRTTSPRFIFSVFTLINLMISFDFVFAASIVQFSMHAYPLPLCSTQTQHLPHNDIQLVMAEMTTTKTSYLYCRIQVLKFKENHILGHKYVNSMRW